MLQHCLDLFPRQLAGLHGSPPAGDANGVVRALAVPLVDVQSEIVFAAELAETAKELLAFHAAYVNTSVFNVNTDV